MLKFNQKGAIGTILLILLLIGGIGLGVYLSQKPTQLASKASGESLRIVKEDSDEALGSSSTLDVRVKISAPWPTAPKTLLKLESQSQSAAKKAQIEDYKNKSKNNKFQKISGRLFSNITFRPPSPDNYVISYCDPANYNNLKSSLVNNDGTFEFYVEKSALFCIQPPKLPGYNLPVARFSKDGSGSYDYQVAGIDCRKKNSNECKNPNVKKLDLASDTQFDFVYKPVPTSPSPSPTIIPTIPPSPTPSPTPEPEYTTKVILGTNPQVTADLKEVDYLDDPTYTRYTFKEYGTSKTLYAKFISNKGTEFISSPAIVDIVPQPSPTPSVSTELKPRIGYAMQLKGGASNQWILVNPTDEFNLTNEFTIETWLKLTEDNSFKRRDIFSYSGINGPYIAFGLNINPHPGKHIPSFFVNVTGGAQILEGKTSLELNKWYHLAVVKKGEVARLYLNGKEDADFINTPLLFDKEIGFRVYDLVGIGAFPSAYNRQPSGDSFTGLGGLLAEMRISKIIRYNDNFIPSPDFKTDSNTIALFPFQGGVNDMSANLYNGQQVGSIDYFDITSSQILENKSIFPPQISVNKYNITATIKKSSGNGGDILGPAIIMTSSGATEYLVHENQFRVGAGFSVPLGGKIEPGQSINLYSHIGSNLPNGVYSGTYQIRWKNKDSDRYHTTGPIISYFIRLID